MSYVKLKLLSIADLWALRQFLDGKNNVLRRGGDIYSDEIKENVLTISAISMILNQRIDVLKQDFRPCETHKQKITHGT